MYRIIETYKKNNDFKEIVDILKPDQISLVKFLKNIDDEVLEILEKNLDLLEGNLSKYIKLKKI